MKPALLAFALLAAFIVLAGCAGQGGSSQQAPPANSSGSNGGGVTGTGAAKTVSVDIRNFAFSPAAVQVNVGDTVTWTNYDTAPHTATSDPGAPVQFDTGQLTQGQSGSFTFTTAGTYAYHCSVHPHMTATVVVS